MGSKNSKSKEKFEAVIVKPSGGLGNQLFEIANGYAYSLRHNRRFFITSSWEGMSKDRPNYWTTYLKGLNKYLVEDKKVKQIKRYKEPKFSYSEVPKFKGHICLEGYYQSEKYFTDYSEAVKKLFTLPQDLIPFFNFKKEGITIAVHIRRGDYLKNQEFHVILDKFYYDNAKKVIEEKLGFRPNYYYFSEDTDWIKENFKDDIKENDKIISGYKDYEELYLMSQCDHFIIANSSFSWWADWLSRLQDENSKIVIAPNVWFGPSGIKDFQDIYCKNWIKINCFPIEKFFLGIITCKKYKHRLENLNISGLSINFSYFIGDPNLDVAVEDRESNIVYLPCPDNYESLPKKVYCMLDWITKNKNDKEFIIKMDDDVKIINIDYFINYIQLIGLNNINYGGVVVKYKGGEEGTCHLGRTEDINLGKTKVIIPKSTYCAGPLYFLSKKSTNIILEDLWKPETKTTIYEDQSIGHCLNLKNIYPLELKLKDNICFWD